MATLETNAPELAQSFLDETFVQQHVAELVNQFLLGSPSARIAETLAAHWRDQFREANERASGAEEPAAIALERFLNDLAVHLSASKAGQEMLQFRAAQEGTSYLRKVAAEPPTLHEANEILVKYLEWLESRHLYLDARGTFQTQRQVQLKLDEIFVELSASEETSIDADMYRSAHASDATEEEDSSVALADLVRRHRLLVILGDPGGGKSTLVRYLALTGAKSAREQVLESDSTSGRSIPILVRVASIVDQKDWRVQSLSESIAAVLEGSECPKEGLSNLIETRLSRGQCLVLFDGLDEVTESDDRRAVVRKIDDFIHRFSEAGNRFVVTSRIAGYREAALGGPVRHFVIRDMTPQQQRDFLEKWCQAVEDAETPDAAPEQRAEVAAREVEAIVGAIGASRGVAALAANPLLLRTLALIHRTGAQLPDKRVELYRLAADTLAQTWRVAQGVPKSALVGEQVLNRILSRVAMWMHANKPAGSASHDEVFDVIAEEWCGMKGTTWDPDNLRDEVAGEVAAFLETVRVQTGLFVERAPNEYGFMHLTFEEYYAARQLIRRRHSAPELRARLHDPRWKEPILLSIGFVGLQYPDDASELVRTAILGQPDEGEEVGYGASRWEELLHRDLLFALECIADGIPVDPVLSKRVVSDSVELIGSTTKGWVTLKRRCGLLLGKISDNPSMPDDPKAEVRTRLLQGDYAYESLFRAARFMFSQDEADDLAIEVFEDDSRELPVRHFALWSLGIPPTSRLSERASMAVVHVIEQGDSEFLGAALNTLDQATLPAAQGDIETTLIELLSRRGEHYDVALKAMTFMQWNASAPRLVQMLIEAARGTRDSSNGPGDALYALSRSAYAEEHVRLVLQIAAGLIGTDDEVDAHFSVASVLGRPIYQTPLEQLVDAEVLERLTGDRSVFVHGEAPLDSAGEHLLGLALASESDQATALYLGALAMEYGPEFWWHPVAARWERLGLRSRTYLARALREVELTYEQWELLARDDSPEVRLTAVHAAALVSQPDRPTGDDARGLLTDSDGAVRATAIAGIDMSNVPDAQSLMRSALFDTECDVRVGALRAATGKRQYEGELREALPHVLQPDRDVWERTAAITALMTSPFDLPLDGPFNWLNNVVPPPYRNNAESSEELEFFARTRALTGAPLDPVYALYGQFVSASDDADFPFWADDAINLTLRLDPNPESAVRTAVLLAVAKADESLYAFNTIMRALQDLAAENPGLRQAIIEAYEESARELFDSPEVRTRVREDALEALESLSQLAPVGRGDEPPRTLS